MYSSIELTYAQFVRDLSGAVEKDTLINCCHVLHPSISHFLGDIHCGRDHFNFLQGDIVSSLRCNRNVKHRIFNWHFSFLILHIGKYHSIAKKSDYSIFFLLKVIFNKKYFLDNNLKIYLLQILENFIVILKTRSYFLLKTLIIKLIEENDFTNRICSNFIILIEIFTTIQNISNKFNACDEFMIDLRIYKNFWKK